MGFRFRRSVRLFPGVRMNLSGSGASFSVGGRGATVNLSSRGVRTTLGVPGTGISWTSSSGSPRASTTTRRQVAPASTTHHAHSEIAAEEEELAALVHAWRLVPPLPSRDDWAAAARERAYASEEPPPAAPTPERVGHELLEGSDVPRAPAASAGTTLLIPVLVGTVGAGVSMAMLGARHPALALLGAVASVGCAVLLRWWALAGLRARDAARVVTAAREARAASWAERWSDAEQAHVVAWRSWADRDDAASRRWTDQERARCTWVRRLVAGDAEAMGESLGDSLSDLDFPFDATCDVAVVDGGTAHLVLDLPEIEDVIPETRGKVLRDGRRKDVKRTKAERASAWGDLATGLALHLARQAFVAAPSLQVVHVGAFTQRSKRGGFADDEWVYEVAVSRDADARLDHRTVPPVDVLRGLGARMRVTTTGHLSKIAPPGWAADLGR